MSTLWQPWLLKPNSKTFELIPYEPTIHLRLASVFIASKEANAYVLIVGEDHRFLRDGVALKRALQIIAESHTDKHFDDWKKLTANKFVAAGIIKSDPTNDRQTIFPENWQIKSLMTKTPEQLKEPILVALGIK